MVFLAQSGKLFGVREQNCFLELLRLETALEESNGKNQDGFRLTDTVFTNFSASRGRGLKNEGELKNEGGLYNFFCPVFNAKLWVSRRGLTSSGYGTWQ